VCSVPAAVRPVARYFGAACLFAALAFAGYWSLRLAWADKLSAASDPETVARAVRLSPDDAGFRVKLARVLDNSGGDPTSALEAASMLNPGDAGVWMRLGISAEMRGDYRGAERDLLEAARVSRQFAPRWALANYYCRRNDADRFWPWARQSLAVGNGDVLGPVFRLCWNISQDADLILDRAIPERRSVLNAYLSFLVQERRLSAGAPVARKLVATATAADCSTLLAWCDRLLGSQDLPAALETWNAMCSRRIATVPGVSCGRSAQGRYMWFSFSGTQPERCEPLSEYLALSPGGHYRLRFQYRTSDIAAQSGLRWQVQDIRTGARLAARSPWLSSPVWTDAEMLFTAEAAGGLARLILTYQSVPGTSRIEGSVLLSHLQLERLP
jgi:hypothetical protein